MEADKNNQQATTEKNLELEKPSDSKRNLLLVFPKSPTQKPQTPRMQEIARVYYNSPKRAQSLSLARLSPQRVPLESLNLSHISQKHQENEGMKMI